MSENHAIVKTTAYVEALSFVVIQVINAPKELVWKAWTQPEHVSEWRGMEGELYDKSVITDHLEELQDGKTKLTFHIKYANEGDLQGALAAGIETEAKDSMERFAQYVGTLMES